MTLPTPTPGPWKASRARKSSNFGGWVAFVQYVTGSAATGAVTIAKVTGGPTDDRHVAEVNARFIAATHDLDAAAGLAITALAFAQETYQRDGYTSAFAQTTAAKEALIAAQNKARGPEPKMRDVTPVKGRDTQGYDTVFDATRRSLGKEG